MFIVRSFLECQEVRSSDFLNVGQNLSELSRNFGLMGGGRCEFERFHKSFHIQILFSKYKNRGSGSSKFKFFWFDPTLDFHTVHVESSTFPFPLQNFFVRDRYSDSEQKSDINKETYVS